MRLRLMPLALAVPLIALVPPRVVAQSDRTTSREVTATSSLCFSDAVHGWLAQRNRVWATSNGGASWRLSFQPRLEAPVPLTTPAGYHTLSLSYHRVGERQLPGDADCLAHQGLRAYVVAPCAAMT